jgi:hypothetical protein
MSDVSIKLEPPSTDRGRRTGIYHVPDIKKFEELTEITKKELM